jgi:flavin reductase (DIM6/NTAB) family NADH-FMN oxidoreductase RutF
MKRVKYGTYPLVYPLPAVLVGAIVDGKTNFETIGNCGIISVEPSVIYISSAKSNYTNRGITEHEVFSVNVPSVDLVERVDYCGLVSGSDTDKSQVFDCFYDSHDKAPMISECPVNMTCKVIRTFEVHNMDVFIGEVIETFVREDCTTNGYADTKKTNPIVYCMDNLYWSIGDTIGRGFNSGKSYKNQ